MAVKKGTPGKGVCEHADSFSYTPVQAGLKNSFNAWLAGEPYWAEEAHEHTDEDKGTKPCVTWLTDGALKCPRCRRGRPVKCIGWVPLYREIDTKPIVVIVHESVSDLLKGLKHPDYCLVGRIDPKSSVFVRKSDTRLSLTTDKEYRKHPVDIIPDLLTMWQLADYEHWLKVQKYEQNAPADAPPAVKQRLSVPPPTTSVEALAIDAEKKAPASWVDGVDDALKRAQRRAEVNGASGTNGKHE